MLSIETSADLWLPYRIRNPLVDVSREDLMADVESFAREAGLTDIVPLLRKGALAAQSPHTVLSSPEFDESEKTVFRQEIEKPWSQPRILYVAIILSSIAAAIQGFAIPIFSLARKTDDDTVGIRPVATELICPSLLHSVFPIVVQFAIQSPILAPETRGLLASSTACLTLQSFCCE